MHPLEAEVQEVGGVPPGLLQEHHPVINLYLKLNVQSVDTFGQVKEFIAAVQASPQLQVTQHPRHAALLQILEDWYNKSTFAIATWRGCSKIVARSGPRTARVRHDQWLQSPPYRRASLEPVYILGDRKLTPEAANAVESVRHGYCIAELIV